MRYLIDHDMHIHSYLSLCSNHGRQIPQAMLDYALRDGLSTIVLTDHYWDERVPGASFNGPYESGTAIWYAMQNTARTDLALPLPQAEGVRFLYGCETEMTKDFRIGISEEEMKRRDFIIIPTTHMHMKGFTVDEGDYCNPERLARLWVERFDTLLNSDLPFHKVGIAHLTTACIAVENQLHLEVIRLIPDSEMVRLFTRAGELGVGIELNGSDFYIPEGYIECVMRPYRIAKECGCKFYLGTDAHKPKEFKTYDNFANVIDLLGLTEDDKYILNRVKKRHE